MLFWCKKIIFQNLEKSLPQKKNQGNRPKNTKKTPKKKEKMFFQFFPRGWFFQNFFLVKTLLVPTFPPTSSACCFSHFCCIFMIFCRFRRFWSSGVGVWSQKMTFFAFIMVGTTKHIIFSNYLAENKVQTVKYSNSQEFGSDFPAKVVGFTVQVYP